MAEVMDLIWGKREGEYFCEGGLDRANHVDRVEEIRFLAQAAHTALS
jgi:hypothetical protein